MKTTHETAFDARAWLAGVYGKTADPNEELAALLSEACTELTNLDGSRNPVAARLASWQRRIDSGEVSVVVARIAE